MRRAAALITGLVIAPLFAIATLGAALMTFVFLGDVIEARSDPARLESNLRHYTDTFTVTPDGAWHLRKSDRPIAWFVLTMLASWPLALLLGWTLERLRRVVFNVPCARAS